MGKVPILEEERAEEREGVPLVDEITVTVPARAEFVPVLRSVVASVAARLQIPYDGIDDLRLAIDEAAGHLMSLYPDGTTLILKLRPGEESVEVLSSVDATPDAWPPPDADRSLTWQILSGLADEAAFERDGDHAAIRFLKRLEIA